MKALPIQTVAPYLLPLRLIVVISQLVLVFIQQFVVEQILPSHRTHPFPHSTFCF